MTPQSICRLSPVQTSLSDFSKQHVHGRSSKAIFLDRDGVINIDFGYVHTWDRFVLLPRVTSSLQMLSELGYKLIIVTNQSGIARKYYTESQFHSLTLEMYDFFSKNGVQIDDVYYCPHHPNGSVPNLTIECSCRKPLPGMILKAAIDHSINLSSSFMIGDKLSDITASFRAGVAHSILLSDHVDFSLPSYLSIRCDSLSEAAKLISDGFFSGHASNVTRHEY